MKVLRILTRKTLYIILFAEIAVCIGLITHFILNRFEPGDPASLATPTSTSQSYHSPGKVTAEVPVRLKIPKLKIDAAIEHVGLTSEGEMEVPKSSGDVAWLNSGPRPGERGSSVIAGHFGLKDNVPAVFDNLHLLQTGDSLYIEDEQGATTTFVVREFRTYAPDEDASGVFAASDSKAHLNLITCRGVWDKSQESYSARLVMFADRETSR